MPAFNRRWTICPDAFPIEQYFADIGLVKPIDCVEQRRLARSVFTWDEMGLA